MEALKAKLEKLEAERTTLKHDNDKLEAKVSFYFLFSQKKIIICLWFSSLKEKVCDGQERGCFFAYATINKNNNVPVLAPAVSCLTSVGVDIKIVYPFLYESDFSLMRTTVFFSVAIID